jgi:acetyl esterase/lipase
VGGVDDPREVLTRPAAPPDHTLRYGDDPDQVIDLRRPAGGGPARPLVVVIHGGFWRAAYDRTHTGPLAADLAARGYPVAQLEYRRTGQPGGGWPGTFDDVAAGLAALPRLVTELVPELAAGQRPVLLGHSAGGQLALWWAGQPAAAVRSVVALAPVADLPAAHRADLGDGAVAGLLGGSPEQVPDRYRYAGPPPRPDIPVTVIHGDQDLQVPVELSRRWVESARAAGGDVTLVEPPGVDHFALIDPVSASWQVVTRAIAEHG